MASLCMRNCLAAMGRMEGVEEVSERYHEKSEGRGKRRVDKG